MLNALRELRAAAGARDFQLLAATFFVCGASTNGLIGTHFIPACGDHGIPEVKAAGFLAAMGVLDLLGTTFSGYLSDRMDSRILLFWYYGLRGLSLLVLPAALNLGDASLTLFTLFYGLDWIATIPPTLKLTNAAFGTIKGPILYGWIVASHQLGAGAAHSIRHLRSELLGFRRPLPNRRRTRPRDRPQTPRAARPKAADRLNISGILDLAQQGTRPRKSGNRAVSPKYRGNASAKAHEGGGGAPRPRGMAQSFVP